MSRLPILTTAGRNPEQQRLFETITGGTRGKVHRTSKLADDEGRLSGPFNAMLYAPALGDTAQRLGYQLRFESSLPGARRETAILTVAQFWRANYEWYAHAPIGRKEGLSDAAIAAIKKGNSPDEDNDQSSVHRFVSELLATRRVSDQTYAATLKLLGEEGTVELVMLTGYYGLVSATLNVFEVQLPAGQTPPFGE